MLGEKVCQSQYYIKLDFCTIVRGQGFLCYLIDTDDIIQVDGFPAIDIGSQ